MTREPTNTEITTSLERILSSHYFVHARRAQAFLRFVTQETLAGRSSTISAYRVAIAVFGKPPDFDADNNPLVRVEAVRLRSRLCEYYATAGKDDVVRIEMKPGSYVPHFRVAATLATEAVAPADTGFVRLWKPERWRIGLRIAGLVAVTVAFGSVGTWSGSAGLEHVGLHVGPRILVQPFDAVEPSETATLAFGITEEILTRLGSYRDVQVLVTLGTGETTGADFLLSGSISTANDRIRVVPRLVDAISGERIWTTVYEEPFSSDGVWEAVDSVARAVTAAVGEPYGPLFDAEVTRNIPGTSIDAYHCLLRFVFALQVVSEGAHARATTCFEQVVAADPRSSTSWARLAALYRMEYLHGFNAKRDMPPALDRAENAARRAIELDANNAFGHEEIAFLCLLRDDRAGFEDAVARTLALKPSADIRTALGINFVKMGQVERGRELIDAGIADSPRAPPFFFLGYAADALRRQDYGAAYGWAQRMAARDWPLSQAFLAATAALAGEPQRGREAAARLRELRPAFAATGRDLIARGRLGSDVESELARGLALAGMMLD
jgi:TolB-like protein/Tfp pilus assembly protein PilF